jgi:hypothetical protein
MPAPGVYFGSGTIFAKPTAGNEGANPTPMAIGVLQDCSFEVSREIKELYGQYQAPVAIAPAKHKFTGKAKFAQIFGKQLSDLIYGQGTANSQHLTQINESHAVPTTPFQVTIAPPSSGTFVEDQGVINSATGLPLTRVASGPTTGQYSVNESTGVYTFASADTGNIELISYVYNLAATGVSMTFVNQLMGYGPIIEVNLVVPYNNSQALLRIFNAVVSKWSFPTKNDDFVIEDFEFAAFANAAGNVFELNTSQ